MPTYGYRCEKNGHEFEVFQGITDPPLTRCKVCGSKVRRIFYPVGIVFKGPGFYKTDSRSSSDSGGAASESKDDSAKPSEKAATVKKAEKSGAKTTKSETPAKK
jgi:putative FmdB family regulatory protein